jgi:hypothetical protein
MGWIVIWLCHHWSSPIQDHGRAVSSLLDIRVKRTTDSGLVDLVGHREEIVADNFCSNRIARHDMFSLVPLYRIKYP